MRTTNLAIKESIKELSKIEGDSEDYHGTFDEILEKRLKELDPDFMKAMDEEYDQSGMSRWYA